MKIGSFEFNLRGLAGSMRDFGTPLPLAVFCLALFGLSLRKIRRRWIA